MTRHAGSVDTGMERGGAGLCERRGPLARRTHPTAGRPSEDPRVSLPGRTARPCRGHRSLLAVTVGASGGSDSWGRAGIRYGDWHLRERRVRRGMSCRETSIVSRCASSRRCHLGPAVTSSRSSCGFEAQRSRAWADQSGWGACRSAGRDEALQIDRDNRHRQEHGSSGDPRGRPGTRRPCRDRRSRLWIRPAVLRARSRRRHPESVRHPSAQVGPVR